MPQHKLDAALQFINIANDDDPNIELSEGKEWPKERLYSHRMSDMLERYKPNANDAIKLAVHAQHIERWKSPRSNFPMNRKGYHQWRTALYTFHANTAAICLQKANYDVAFIERVKLAIGKKNLKSNTDSQLLEDVAALVFIEHYMLGFAEKHPEYDEEKWLLIVRRTWGKMSKDAQIFALAGNISLPEPLVPLILKAIKS